jgi:hypothetical protein
VTIADGLRTTLSARTLAAIRAHVAAIGTASEEAIVWAMRMTWERMKVVIEPSAAVPLACLLDRSLDVAGARVGIIVSVATSISIDFRGRPEERMPVVALGVLKDLATRALVRAGANPAMASATAAALVYADARGLHRTAHRASPSMRCTRQWRADGAAQPEILRSKGATVLVDAKCGLAFPACALAVGEAIRRAREFGVAYAGVTNSHHFGAAAYHLEPVGAAGLSGLPSVTRRQRWQ